MLRDDIETILRAWDMHETNRGASAVIDYDCHPTDEKIAPADSRLAVYRQLDQLHSRAADTGEHRLRDRLGADLSYLRTLMGERAPLDEYIRATQGCPAAGWPDNYVTAIGERAREQLDAIGIAWGPKVRTDLDEAEGPLNVEAASEAIQQAAEALEPSVRHATGTTASYELTIETTNLDTYWSYWLDGVGPNIRLRLNLRNARFTTVRARQFALHEVLGHGLQCASFAARCTSEEVPWVRLLSVHAPHQVLLEGLAQALPLLITPDDEPLTTRVRLDHYLQLICAELHQMINAGTTIGECAAHAKARVPFWTDVEIADALSDRGVNPLLRSYLWSYPAGIDWFTALATTNATVVEEVLHAAYREPLTPGDLTTLWPDGPPIGGPGGAVRLRQPPLP